VSGTFRNHLKNAHQDPELPKNITIKGVEASKETSEKAFHGRIGERYSEYRHSLNSYSSSECKSIRRLQSSPGANQDARIEPYKKGSGEQEEEVEKNSRMFGC
jgi:hypothetical protein